MIDEKKRLFYELVKAIDLRAMRYNKKHGEWMRLDIGDNLSICMDSWSRRIWVYKNAKFKNGVAGFSGDEGEYIGIDFGGIEIHATEYRLRELIKIVEELE